MWRRWRWKGVASQFLAVEDGTQTTGRLFQNANSSTTEHTGTEPNGTAAKLPRENIGYSQRPLRRMPGMLATLWGRFRKSLARSVTMSLLLLSIKGNGSTCRTPSNKPHSSTIKGTIVLSAPPTAPKPLLGVETSSNHQRDNREHESD